MLDAFESITLSTVQCEARCRIAKIWKLILLKAMQIVIYEIQ